MDKIVRIGDKDVPMRATGKTAIIFRQKFGKDLLVFFTNNAEKMASGKMPDDVSEMISYAAYVMAKQADDTVPDDPLEWFDQFGMFDLTIAMPQILELWGLNSKTLAKPKKK